MILFDRVYMFLQLFTVIHNIVGVEPTEIESKMLRIQDEDSHVTPFELRKLLIFLNSMKETNLEMLIQRLRINEEGNSLSEFVENAWDRRLNFQFESSFVPVYILCQDKQKKRLNRRGGAVLEVNAKSMNTNEWERYRWIAVFRHEKDTGYYLEYLKNLETIHLESEDNKLQDEIIMDSLYECPVTIKLPDDKKEDTELHRKREEFISGKIENGWRDDGYEF